MTPILFSSTTTSFDSHGVGPLREATSCQVREALNDKYELTLTLPVSSRHFAALGDRSIILAKPNPYDPLQPFRVDDITKTARMTAQVHARHLSYDLDGFPIAPFTAATAAAAVAAMNNSANRLVPNDFVFSTDISKSAPMQVEVPTVARALLGEQEQSLLRLYGGELAFDRYRVQLLSRRGADRGFVLAYGKNLIDLTQERNISKLYTGVLPYWTDGDTVVRGSVQSAAGTWDYQRVLPVDLSSEFDSKPTVAQLNTAGRAYITRERVGVPQVNIQAKFVPPGSSGIVSLDELQLGDDVTVRFEKLGIEEKSRMVAYTYDVMSDRYESVEIGEVRETAAAAIADAKRLKTGTIPTERYGSRSIGGGSLKKSAVSADELADKSVTVNKIVDGAVVSVKIEDGAVTRIKVLDQAIAYAKLSNSLQVFYNDTIAANALFAGVIYSAGSVSCSTLIVDGHQYMASGIAYTTAAGTTATKTVLARVQE